MKRKRGPISGPGQSLFNFTNRVSERARFSDLLDLPEREHLPVSFFYGVGGAGKSWLLQTLRTDVSAREDIPFAYLDFSVLRNGHRYHHDHAAVLAEIQRQLGVACPRFEVAYHTMLWKQHKRDPPSNEAGEAAGFGWQIAVALGQDATTWIPGTNVAGKVLEKLGEVAGQRLRGSVFGRWLESRGASGYLRELLRKTDQEIHDELIYRLAEDLHEHLPRRIGKQCRAVMIFDTYEDLVRGTGHRKASKDRRAREQWIQDLYRALLDEDDSEPHGTVLFVIGGRDRADWDDDFADPRYFDPHFIAGLSEADARAFLEKCGIGGRLQEAILRICPDDPSAASAGSPRYHAFSLGLCADTVAQERATGSEPEPATFALTPGALRELVDRFLASFHGGQEDMVKWLYRLALPPHWDEAAARYAYSAIADVRQDVAWETLRTFSFVAAPQPGQPWWTLHVTMRDALRAAYGDIAERERSDHLQWREFWASRSRSPSDAFNALAWYHGYRLDPEAGLKEWRERAESSRRSLRMSDHLALLGWWSPTSLSTVRDLTAARAQVIVGFEFTVAGAGERATNLHRAIHLYEAALQSYTEQDTPQHWALTMQYLGDTWTDMPVGDRTSNLQTAIGFYQAALPVAEERAATLRRLGEAYAALPTGSRKENVERAIGYYRSALGLLDSEREPWEWATAWSALGDAYLQLPRGILSDAPERAIECYQKASEILTEAAYPRDWARIMTHFGLAYASLSATDPATKLRRAGECYIASLRVRTEAEMPWEWAATIGNLGNVFLQLPYGNREENLKHAVNCYEGALRVHSVERSPHAWAHNVHNLGLSYRELSNQQDRPMLKRAIACFEAVVLVYNENDSPREWARSMEALASACSMPYSDPLDWPRAVECYEAALRILTEREDPYDWAALMYNLGTGYLATGDPDAGIERFEAALRVLNEASAPQRWAQVMAGLGQAYLHFEEDWDRAVDCFHNALRVSTESAAGWDWANTMYNLGRAWLVAPAQYVLEAHDRAVGYFECALRVYTETGSSDRWALALTGLGDACSENPNLDRVDRCGRALRCYEAALRVHTETSQPRAWADLMRKLGDVHRTLSDRQRALECYNAAASHFRDDPERHGSWMRVTERIGDLCAEQVSDSGIYHQRAIAAYERMREHCNPEWDPYAVAYLTERIADVWSRVPGAGAVHHDIIPSARAFEAYSSAAELYRGAEAALAAERCARRAEEARGASMQVEEVRCDAAGGTDPSEASVMLEQISVVSEPSLWWRQPGIERDRRYRMTFDDDALEFFAKVSQSGESQDPTR